MWSIQIGAGGKPRSGSHHEGLLELTDERHGRGGRNARHSDGIEKSKGSGNRQPGGDNGISIPDPGYQI